MSQAPNTRAIQRVLAAGNYGTPAQQRRATDPRMKRSYAMLGTVIVPKVYPGGALVLV